MVDHLQNTIIDMRICLSADKVGACLLLPDGWIDSLEAWRPKAGMTYVHTVAKRMEIVAGAGGPGSTRMRVRTTFSTFTVLASHCSVGCPPRVTRSAPCSPKRLSWPLQEQRSQLLRTCPVQVPAPIAPRTRGRRESGRARWTLSHAGFVGSRARLGHLGGGVFCFKVPHPRLSTSRAAVVAARRPKAYEKRGSFRDFVVLLPCHRRRPVPVVLADS